MYPIITIGTFEISFYVTLRLMAIALLLLVWVTLRLRRSQLPVTLRMFFLDGLPWLIVGLVVGGAVENGVPLPVAWAVRSASPPPEWWGSSRWLGALGGASLMGYLYCRRRELPVGQAFDLFAVPLAVAVARVGCLLNGCRYFRTPPVLLGDLPGNPLVGFDGRCGFVSRLESVAPGVPFTHTHWLENYGAVVRTFTITAPSSQGVGLHVLLLRRGGRASPGGARPAVHGHCGARAGDMAVRWLHTHAGRLYAAHHRYRYDAGDVHGHRHVHGQPDSLGRHLRPGPRPGVSAAGGVCGVFAAGAAPALT